MENPGIRVGDIVYLRQDLQVDGNYGGLEYLSSMKPLKYKGFEVVKLNSVAVLLQTNSIEWWYTFEMLDLEMSEFPSKEILMDFLNG